MLLLVLSASAQEVPYRGPGGQLEAAGAIAAVFAVTTATIDACAKQPLYASQARSSGGGYVARNQPVFVSAMGKLPAIAQRNGGDAEVLRLKGELESSLGQLENFARGAADARTKNPGDCKAFLRRVNAREMDLRTLNSEHLRRVGL